MKIINTDPLFASGLEDSVSLKVYNNICGALQAYRFDARYDTITDGLLIERPNRRGITGWGLFAWVRYHAPGIEIIVKHDGRGLNDDLMRIKTTHHITHHRKIAETIIQMIAGLDMACGVPDYY